MDKTMVAVVALVSAVSQNCTVVGSFRADRSDRDRDKELPILERHGELAVLGEETRTNVVIRSDR